MSDREWEAIEDFLLPEEQRLAICHGWAPGGLVDDVVDHPCVVYLTDMSVTIDVHPQTLLEKPPVLHMDQLDIMAWGAERHPGGLRLMLISRPPVSEEIFSEAMGEEPEMGRVGVDLPRGRAGKKFVRSVEKVLGKDRHWRPGRGVGA